MKKISGFVYEPGEHEAEKASNSYLMSLIALIAGIPLPIVNLLATLGFYMANRRGTYFVRWHCTQALVSQASLLLINSVGFWWTISIIFSDEVFSNQYFSYILAALIFNIIEFFVTIYTAVATRKGNHVRWIFYGELADMICKKGDRESEKILWPNVNH